MKDALAEGRVHAGGKDHPVLGGMIETAENVRKRYSIGREEQDRLAVRSHEKATAAVKDGRFADELVPVTVPGRKSDTVVEADEHIRPDAALEKLATLRPIMGKQDPDATVTAGNASGQNDGAAVCIVTTPDKAAELGLRPLARLVSWGVAGVGPEVMGIGPVPATEAALGRAGLSLADLDVIELNEAFAAQALGVGREWGIDLITDERVNPNGSGISLGHPVGATGVRILATMLREMERREARYGLETMCIGGGQGLAAVFERSRRCQRVAAVVSAPPCQRGSRFSRAAVMPSTASSVAPATRRMVSPKRMASVSPQVRRPAGHLLDRPLGQGRAGEQAVGERAGLGQQVVVRDDARDEADLPGALGVDALAGEQQLHRAAASRCARGRRIAPTIVGMPRRTSGKPNVARSLAITRSHQRDERQPVAQAVPVHRGDHRLVDLPAALERVDRRALPERAGEVAGRVALAARVGARRRTPGPRRSRCRPTPRRRRGSGRTPR